MEEREYFETWHNKFRVTQKINGNELAILDCVPCMAHFIKDP